jgi:hypothetical protein
LGVQTCCFVGEEGKLHHSPNDFLGWLTQKFQNNRFFRGPDRAFSTFLQQIVELETVPNKTFGPAIIYRAGNISEKITLSAKESIL